MLPEAGVVMKIGKYGRKGRGCRISSRAVILLLLSVICFTPGFQTLDTFDFKHANRLNCLPASVYQDRLVCSVAPVFIFRAAVSLSPVVHSATVSVLDLPLTYSFPRIVELARARFLASIFVDSTIKVRAPPQGSFYQAVSI
jgi:hypothetical protein